MLGRRKLCQRIRRCDKNCGGDGREQLRKFFHDVPLLSGNSKVSCGLRFISGFSSWNTAPLCAASRRRSFSSPKTTLNVLKSRDRKSTRLNSSHLGISYAVFCL